MSWTSHPRTLEQLLGERQAVVEPIQIKLVLATPDLQQGDSCWKALHDFAVRWSLCYCFGLHRFFGSASSTPIIGRSRYAGALERQASMRLSQRLRGSEEKPRSGASISAAGYPEETSENESPHSSVIEGPRKSQSLYRRKRRSVKVRSKMLISHK